MSKPFTISNPGAVVAKCPKCSNNTEFVAHSMQDGIDHCSVWVVCKCGYDPTELRTGHRLEDAMGTIDKITIAMAIDIWTDIINEQTQTI